MIYYLLHGVIIKLNNILLDVLKRMMIKKNYLFIILDGILGKTNISSIFFYKIHLFSHDEWVKLDRVIERRDSTNASTLFQQRPRRTSIANTSRQQHLDSTNSIEQINPQQIPNSSITDIHSTPSLIDDEEQNKTLKTKIDESDIDDNSQGQSESNYKNNLFNSSFHYSFSLESC